MGFPSSLLRGAVMVLALASLAGCGEKLANAQTGGGTPPPPEVSIVTVEPQSVAVTNELPGRLEASRMAEVRARVPGIVLKRAFREGSDVKAGQLLFKIDPAPYRAAYQSAEAAVARADASVATVKVKVERYKPLVETNAISKQEFDEAVAAEKQAVADVAAAKAALEAARINLSYADVTAPISGRIGRAQVTEGALVGQGAATPLATIQQLDPIYVNITQSANEALALQRAMRDGQLQKSGKNGAKVTILMQDGEPYPHAGKLLFSDLAVDPETGAIMLRALVPNPDNFLLPGMYVRARVEQAVRDNAIAVPQQAVQRTPQGAVVMVVDQENKVTPRPVKADSSRGDQWIISEGLKAGERVMVEGFQKAPPGAVVNPVPWKQAADKSSANGATGATGMTPAAGATQDQKQAPKK
jgi:membrane fusion protein (multidrug efflux system)